MNVKNGNLLVYKNGRWLMGSGSGNIRDTLHITLTAAGWANNQQVIPCNSVGSNSTVMPNPTAASKQAYINAGIELTEATTESLTFTCATEAPTEDIAVLVHIIDPLITVESTKILTFDSVDEMNAYEAEDGAIAIVPSEEDTVIVEITTPASDATSLTSEESALLTDAWNKGKNVVLKAANVTVSNIPISNLVTPTMKGVLGDAFAAYAISFGATVVLVSAFVQNDGTVSGGAGWSWQIM